MRNLVCLKIKKVHSLITDIMNCTPNYNECIEFNLVNILTVL